MFDYFEEIGMKLVCECSEQFKAQLYLYVQCQQSPQLLTIFACNARLLPLIVEAGAIHSGENPSNHSAIYAKVDIGEIDTSEEKVTIPKHMDWSAATAEAKAEYGVRLTEQLDNLAVPACVQCTDVQCTINDHALDIEH